MVAGSRLDERCRLSTLNTTIFGLDRQEWLQKFLRVLVQRALRLKCTLVVGSFARVNMRHLLIKNLDALPLLLDDVLVALLRRRSVRSNDGHLDRLFLVFIDWRRFVIACRVAA